MTNIHCIAVVGSTGTGKTALSLSIAEYLSINGYSSAIINMDSQQIYKELPIITAHPTEQEQQLYPHHYYGYLSITDSTCVEKHIHSVYSLCNTLWKQDIIPILVGGTGMYFYILFNGIASIPPINEVIRHSQREFVLHNKEEAYYQLLYHDPVFAKSITPGDTQRIARGLEVFYSTGIPLSQWYTNKKTFLQLHTSIGIKKPLSLLHQHLHTRILTMLQQGALEEVQSICSTYHEKYIKNITCIGFQEVKNHIEGMLSYQQCIEQWFIHTRQYAKRQRTWFNNKHTVHYWIEDVEYKKIPKIIKKYLASLNLVVK